MSRQRGSREEGRAWVQGEYSRIILHHDREGTEKEARAEVQAGHSIGRLTMTPSNIFVMSPNLLGIKFLTYEPVSER